MESSELRIEAKDLNRQSTMLIKAGNYDAAKAKALTGGRHADIIR